MPTLADHEKIIIEGITQDGRIFRPSDWVERLCDSFMSYGPDRRSRRAGYRGPERRACSIQFLWPQMIDGTKCLVIDLRLQETNPVAYGFVMDFVHNNHLRTRHCQLNECIPPKKPEKPGSDPNFS